MKFTVLLVDDDAAIRSILRSVLELRGFDVTSCESATQARAVLAKSSFDLVLTDMRMETEKAGYEVVRSAKAASSTTIIVLLTAFPIPTSEWRSAGADALYMKGSGIFGALDEIEQMVQTNHKPT